MTVQVSETRANAELDAGEVAMGTSVQVAIFEGSPPANCAAANSGTELWRRTLASDWASGAASGEKGWSGLPLDDTVDTSGTPGHYRMYASDGTTCHEQGTVTITGDGGDMTVDSTTWTAGQTFQITAKSQAHGNYP